MFCIIRNVNQQTTVVCWGNPDKSQTGPLFFVTPELAKEFIHSVTFDSPLEGPWLIRDADHCFKADDGSDLSASWIVAQWGESKYSWTYFGNGMYVLAT